MIFAFRLTSSNTRREIKSNNIASARILKII